MARAALFEPSFAASISAVTISSKTKLGRDVFDEKLADLEAQGQSTVTSQQQMQAAQLVGRQVTYVDATGNLVEGVVESAEYTPDGQSLTIDGQAVELDNITKVVGNNRVDGASEAVSALGPSLASSFSPSPPGVVRRFPGDGIHPGSHRLFGLGGGGGWAGMGARDLVG